MKRFFLLLSALVLTVAAHAADKNTVVLRPGDIAYVRFENAGKKIRVANVSKEKDDAAQVIFNLSADPKDGLKMKVENNFPRDLLYKVELRSLRLKREMRAPSTPVVANKIAIETYPPMVEEIALYDFRLEK